MLNIELVGRYLWKFAWLDMNPVKAAQSQVTKIQLIDLLKWVAFTQDSRKFHIGNFLLNHTESTTVMAADRNGLVDLYLLCFVVGAIYPILDTCLGWEGCYGGHFL